MYKMVLDAGISHNALYRFEKKVNDLLEAGWIIVNYHVEKSIAKFLCQAVLCTRDEIPTESNESEEE